MVRLRDLCDDWRQDIVSGPFGSNLKREHFMPNGVPVLKLQNVRPWRLELGKLDYVSVQKARELQRHSFVAGDLVVTKLGDPLGAAAIVEGLEAGIIVADLVRIRPSGIDRKYLCYQINSPASRKFLNSKQEGATRPRVKLDVLRDLPIYLPTEAEQERIVAILDEAFKAISSATVNAEKNLTNSVELFSSILNDRCTPRDDWRLQELQEDVKFIDYRGRTPKKTKTGIRLITAKNVRMGLVKEEPREFVDPSSYESWMTRGVPRSGDVLFTTEAPLGLVAQLDTDEKTVFAQRIITLAPERSRIDPAFLHYMLRSPDVQRRIHAEATGATARGIRASLLKRIRIALPQRVGVQRQIAANLAEAEAHCRSLGDIQSTRVDQYASLRSSILSVAMSGSLEERTSGVADLVSEAGL